MTDLTNIVQAQIEAYARGGWAKAKGYVIADTKRHIYTVIGIPNHPRKFPASIIYGKNWCGLGFRVSRLF